MDNIKLRKPNEEEFRYWIKRSTKQQAKDRAYVNDFKVKEELEGLNQILPILLPEGKDTHGAHFRVLDTDN